MADTATILSKLNENGQPYLGNCDLIMADGTVKVEIRNGRAEGVPIETARLAASRADLDVIADGAAVEPLILDSPETVEYAEKQTTAETLRASKDPSMASENVESADAAVELAKQHLAEEGAEVPQTVAAPDGFDLRTADGELRCLARKGDGSQCSNSADDSHACGIVSHKAQVADLPPAA